MAHLIVSVHLLRVRVPRDTQRRHAPRFIWISSLGKVLSHCARDTRDKKLLRTEVQRFCSPAIVGQRVNSSRGILSLQGFLSGRVFSGRGHSGPVQPSAAQRNSLTSMNGGLETVMIIRDRSRACKLLLRSKFHSVGYRVPI